MTALIANRLAKEFNAMSTNRHGLLVATATLLSLAVGTGVGQADTISVTLGTPSGFADGSMLTIGVWAPANAGTALFEFEGFDTDDASFGFSAFVNPFAFAYSPIADPILSASITFGIYDHDSATAGDQVALFDLDGTDLTTDVNTLFNASGGSTGFFTGEYNIYTMPLSPALFAGIADGSLTATLRLQNGEAFAPTVFNGASIDFARLDIETRPPAPVPEPSSLVLLLTGLATARGLARRRGSSDWQSPRSIASSR